MIPSNLEKLLTYNNYDYYVIEETGFSNKDLANDYSLYENFFENGVQYSSTFQDIYNQEIYCDNKISQIWIFKDEHPVGICMGIRHNSFHNTYASKLGFQVAIPGYIQLYVKDEHRGQGLASKCIPLLESMLHEKKEYPAAFIMKDNAFPFGKYLKKGCAIPSQRCHGDFFTNRLQVETFFQDILSDEQKIFKYAKDYPGFAQQYLEYLKAQNKKESSVVRKFG